MASAGSAGASSGASPSARIVEMTEEEVIASPHYPVLSEITNDFVLLEKWCRSLKDYKYIDLASDEEDCDGLEEREIIRYIDMRKIPLKLSLPFQVVTFTDETIRLKTMSQKPFFWTIIRRFCLVFQKKNFRDKLLAAVVKLENKYGLTE
jgi:hypothetical protein